VSPYSDKINALLKKLETYPEFDSSTIYESPEYLALQERTRQIADKTRRNTMADAAAMTGGIPSSYALAAAKALKECTDLSAREIVVKAMEIAASICVYTNSHFTVEEL